MSSFDGQSNFSGASGRMALVEKLENLNKIFADVSKRAENLRSLSHQLVHGGKYQAG